MNTNTVNKQTIRFRRFTRQGYAAFASLHKEVVIVKFSSQISDSQMRKDRKELSTKRLNSLALSSMLDCAASEAKAFCDGTLLDEELVLSLTVEQYNTIVAPSSASNKLKTRSKVRTTERTTPPTITKSIRL